MCKRTFKPILSPQPRGCIVQLTSHQHHREVRSEGGTIILFVLDLYQIVKDREGFQ